MANFILSPEALQDLDAIWLYIAQDNPSAADRLVEDAYQVCQRLAEHPELGPVRHFQNDDPPGIRFIVIPRFRNCLVFYRATGTAVEILRVLHGAQDIDDLFSR